MSSDYLKGTISNNQYNPQYDTNNNSIENRNHSNSKTSINTEKKRASVIIGGASFPIQLPIAPSITTTVEKQQMTTTLRDSPRQHYHTKSDEAYESDSSNSDDSASRAHNNNNNNNVRSPLSSFLSKFTGSSSSLLALPALTMEPNTSSANTAAVNANTNSNRNSLRGNMPMNIAGTNNNSSSAVMYADQDFYSSKAERFKKILKEPNIDLAQLQKLSWSGIPAEVRPMTWQLLTGYLPCNSDRRQATLERKRREYSEFIPQYYDAVGTVALTKTEYERKIQQQIHIDVPRTHPTLPLFKCPQIQQALERILYIWSIRHPASAYVQGINDLVTPFLTVFLKPFVEGDVLQCETLNISAEDFATVEADSYWCFSKLMDSIQDHYTFAHPGIQRSVHKLKEIIHRIDAPLHDHFEDQGLQFIQFSFRWMNNLLMREFPLPLVIRMWDTYLAEGDDFASLHVYVCAAFLKNWSDKLLTLPFDQLVIFLQDPPTDNWTYKEMELLLSQAYMLKELYHNSPSHFRTNSKGSSQQHVTL